MDGRLIHLASQDFTVLGGSAGEVHSHKVADAMEMSLRSGSPFVFLNDSGGARVQEGIDSLSGYGRVFHANVLLSGAVPELSVICGPCAGGAVYSPALTDFIIQTRQAQMFITGPQVIKQVTGESISAEALGRAGHQRLDEGGPLRPLLQRLQRAAGDVQGDRPRLRPAGRLRARPRRAAAGRAGRRRRPGGRRGPGVPHAAAPSRSATC